MQQVSVGKIVKPQGLNGEVKILLSTDNLAVFNNLKYLYVGVSKAKIESLRLNDQFAFVKFAGIDDVDKAEMLRGKFVSVDKNDFLLPEDQYLIEDILDSQIFDKQNNFVGKLVDVEQYGAADIWVIFADGREYQIPFLKEIFVKVLPQQKLIIVDKEKFDQHKIC